MGLCLLSDRLGYFVKKDEMGAEVGIKGVG